MGEVTNRPEDGDREASAEDLESPMEEDFDDEFEDLTSEELEAIDNKLDALNVALDAMESKREEIHQQLVELLESSRKIRKELQQKHKIEAASQESP